MGRKRKYNTEEELNEAKRLARKKYVEKNREKVREQVNNWYSNNKEDIKEKRGVYVLSDEQKEKMKRYKNKYYKDNKREILDYNNIYRKERKLSDPLYKLTSNIRCNVSKSLRENGYRKNSKTEDILGCTFEEFKSHLENKWEPWMNWDNHGKYNGESKYGWDIDHIVPCSSAITENNILELNHYTNLQPLCSHINRDVKKDKLSMDF